MEGNLYGVERVSTKKQDISRQIRNILAVYSNASIYLKFLFLNCQIIQIHL